MVSGRCHGGHDGGGGRGELRRRRRGLSRRAGNGDIDHARGAWSAWGPICACTDCQQKSKKPGHHHQEYLVSEEADVKQINGNGVLQVHVST